MNKKIIIVQGYLAAGKSTFARQSAKELGLPCFVKDTFKNALCAGVPIDSQAISSRFSAVTFDAMMYTAERLMEASFPLMIEGNFLPAGIKKTDEAGTIRALIGKYGYRALAFRFVGDIEVLYQRFLEREGTAERGKANTRFTLPTVGEFGQWCRNMDRFDVGGAMEEIDTTDFTQTDFTRYIGIARGFLSLPSR